MSIEQKTQNIYMIKWYDSGRFGNNTFIVKAEDEKTAIKKIFDSEVKFYESEDDCGYEAFQLKNGKFSDLGKLFTLHFPSLKGNHLFFVDLTDGVKAVQNAVDVLIERGIVNGSADDYYIRPVIFVNDVAKVRWE